MHQKDGKEISHRCVYKLLVVNVCRTVVIFPFVLQFGLAISWHIAVCTFPCELLCSAVPLVSRASGCSLWTAACSHSAITEVQLPARSEGEGEKRALYLYLNMK